MRETKRSADICPLQAAYAPGAGAVQPVRAERRASRAETGPQGDAQKHQKPPPRDGSMYCSYACATHSSLLFRGLDFEFQRPSREARLAGAAILDLVLPWRDTDRRSPDHQHLPELLCPVFRLHRDLGVIQGDRLPGLDGPFERGEREAAEVPVLRHVDADLPTLVSGHLGPAVVWVEIRDRNLGLAYVPQLDCKLERLAHSAGAGFGEQSGLQAIDFLAPRGGVFLFRFLFHAWVLLGLRLAGLLLDSVTLLLSPRHAIADQSDHRRKDQHRQRGFEFV